MARLTVTPLGVIGAEVALPAGLDIATAPGAADRPLLFAEIRAALLRHSVLAFRGQPIVSDEQHAAFAACLGEVEAPLPEDPLAAPGGAPVMLVSNVDAAGRLVPPSDPRMVYTAGNGVWHSASPLLPPPPWPCKAVHSTSGQAHW